jgi:hypothetical protein
VGTTAIVMRDPLGQDLSQMPFVERDDVVQTFATCPADQALAERVGLRHSGRRLQHTQIINRSTSSTAQEKTASRSCTTNRRNCSPVEMFRTAVPSSRPSGALSHSSEALDEC